MSTVVSNYLATQSCLNPYRAVEQFEEMYVAIGVKGDIGSDVVVAEGGVTLVYDLSKVLRRNLVG